MRYVGFTVPDELFVGYGFDLRRAATATCRTCTCYAAQKFRLG